MSNTVINIVNKSVGLGYGGQMIKVENSVIALLHAMIVGRALVIDFSTAPSPWLRRYATDRPFTNATMNGWLLICHFGGRSVLQHFAKPSFGFLATM